MVLSSDGTASFTSSTLAVASHTISASFSDDVKYGPSMGQAGETVSTARTTTSVASSSSTPDVGQSVTFTAAVSAVSPSAQRHRGRSSSRWTA